MTSGGGFVRGIERTPGGHRLTVWSRHATAMELRVFDATDPDWLVHTVPMERVGEEFTVDTALLQVGTPYAIGVHGPAGPGHAFDPDRHAVPPHARGIVRTPHGQHRATVTVDDFDWGGVERPRIPRQRQVIYEAHVKGLTKLSPHMPKELRGTYAGLAHPSTIAYLKDLGVTTVQLLPIHLFVSEQRLIQQGRVNHWGYNSLSWFAPHIAYASRQAQFDGTGGVLREVKGMVRLLHEAGLQVFLDVVYNHTAEEGAAGPPSSLRLIDSAAYYRHDDEGRLVDWTGCGNTVDLSEPAAQELVLDSLRYWHREMQVDGFRFDLAVTLGRGADGAFDPQHPLLRRILADPALASATMIAEPWDIGPDGWQTGRFPTGFSEWNDRFRDTVRQFWLSDYRSFREGGHGATGVGPLAHAVSGSEGLIASERGPVESLNFITAHDGFTLTDLTRYDRKHNEANGEDNRDGADENRSYNHGVEGRSDDIAIELDRRKSMRNLLGTLLVSAGVPMLTMGDEFGRTQRGNNNAYCQDSALTWMRWERKDWQDAFLEQTRRLLRLRREHPALRPREYGQGGQRVAGSSRLDWYNADGLHMTIDDWDHSHDRTMQMLAESTPVDEPYSRVLVIFHGSPRDRVVVLPEADGTTDYELLWDSALDGAGEELVPPGAEIGITPMSLRVYAVHGLPAAGTPAPTVVRYRTPPTAPATPPAAQPLA
ncbi:glycogen debranching protein GlgX [Agrococcus sp. HG114]|uniref:glycogen debranching protein GlgX n=1 Tax=Agrococcus sp. HG114 TaxID=2969757 RepID=UPI00215A3819|nr:glycogen debranching protein GlgX [Agrococcus sp. HG114]MCR8670906.1 glycogen debranching protein GlgX [Agrococcus sp. HG114]